MLYGYEVNSYRMCHVIKFDTSDSCDVGVREKMLPAMDKLRRHNQKFEGDVNNIK